MTKAFESKVLKEGIVDTKNYRYRFVSEPCNVRIERIEIYKLDTTLALTDWEIVKKI